MLPFLGGIVPVVLFLFLRNQVISTVAIDRYLSSSFRSHRWILEESTGRLLIWLLSSHRRPSLEILPYTYFSVNEGFLIGDGYCDVRLFIYRRHSVVVDGGEAFLAIFVVIADTDGARCMHGT